MTGKTLQCKRKELGITQKDLAGDLCVSVGAVSLWESDQRKIPQSIEKLFCLLYGLEFKPYNVGNFDNQPDLFSS